MSVVTLNTTLFQVLSYLRTGDGSKWRELLAQFLVIDGVIKVLDVQVNTLVEEVQQAS